MAGEIASVQSLQSLAASGTATVPIQVSNNTQNVVIQVSAQYAAVSATASGISANYSLSTNNGTSYVASLQPSVTVAPAAGVLGNGVSVMRLDSRKLDTIGAVTNLRVNLTNTDGSNAALVAVTAQTLNHQA